MLLKVRRGIAHATNTMLVLTYLSNLDLSERTLWEDIFFNITYNIDHEPGPRPEKSTNSWGPLP